MVGVLKFKLTVSTTFLESVIVRKGDTLPMGSINREPVTASWKRLFGHLGWFSYVWLVVGFATGTALLVGPVQWINSVGRSLGWTVLIERIVMVLIIMIFVSMTALISWWLTTRFITKGTWGSSGFLLVLSTVGAGIALGMWMNPVYMTGAEDPIRMLEGNPRFAFGNYPTEERIRELEQEGFTAVVSLLHPAVVPFEPALISRQKRMLRNSPLEFVHAPMLPWISDNEQTMGVLRELVNRPNGKFYVHCYLGMDRVNLAKRIILRASGKSPDQFQSSGRDIRDRDTFERGPIYRLSDSVVVSPFPTEEEFLAYVFGGRIQQVVSLIADPGPSMQKMLERERTLMDQYGLPFYSLPIPTKDGYDPDRALEVVERIRSFEGNTLVHAFRTDRSSPEVEAFVMAYHSGLPPLPPSLFDEPLERGELLLVGVDRLLGPRPVGSEWADVLARGGVRDVVYVSANRDEATADMRSSARTAGLTWHEMDTIGSPADANLPGQGPWYVYGSALNGSSETRSDTLSHVLDILEGTGEKQ